MFKHQDSNIWYQGEIWAPWIYQNMTHTMRDKLVEELNSVNQNAYDKGYLTALTTISERIQELEDG